MKRKLFSSLMIMGLLIFPTSAFAEGNEGNEPEHKISEAHEGIEGGELFAAGAGLVIALGLAFMIGRRSSKRD
jgi:hypothetical protein